jgi:hypothetical protein
MGRAIGRFGRALPLLLLLGCAADQAVGPLQPQVGEGREIAAGVYQLTGTHLRRMQTNHDRLPELPDPAPPFTASDGAVEIYGSAGYYIRYADWAEYARSAYRM